MLDRLKARSNSYAHLIKANIYNKLGFLTYPYTAHLIPTWRCNLRCKTCNAWKRKADPELSTEDMIKALTQLKSLDIIKIIGGEPFLRNDLHILVNEIRKTINPYIIQIVTNGFLTDKILEFAESTAYEAIHFRVSLDGIGRIHDSIRGVEGAFENAYSTLKGLVKLRERKKIIIGINFSVTDETLQDMEEVIGFCNDLRIDFAPGIPVTPFLEDVNTNEASHKTVKFTDRNIFQEKYKKNIISERKGLNFLERRFFRKINNDIFNRLIFGKISRKFLCRELRNLIYLHPNGDIVTCGLNHKKVGNLIEKDLRDIWFGKEIETFRNNVDRCPGCLQSAVEILSRIYFLGK